MEYNKGMCGRYQFNFSDPVRFRTRYSIKGKYPEGEIKTRYNVAPGQMMPVIVSHSPNSVAMMRWGLIPHWEKSASPRGLINLRDDTVTTKSWAFKYLEFQRCLIPASVFYEWKQAKEEKIPYYISLTEDYFSFAGLYSVWKHPSDQEISSYAILTTSPNSFMESIHHRMPVILEEEEEKEWLNPDNAEIETLKAFLHPYRGEMKAHPVSRRINSPRNDDSQVILPADEQIRVI
jgi:putative SOS response-associated peptidase YedK